MDSIQREDTTRLRSPSAMKMLSAMTFVALVAMAAVVQGASTQRAWFSRMKRHISFACLQSHVPNVPGFSSGPDSAFFAQAINSNGEVMYSKGRSVGSGLVLGRNEKIKSPGKPNSVCKGYTGLKLPNGQTYCGLSEVIFMKEGKQNVRMVLRFNGIEKGDEKGRLEIPLAELTEDEAKPEYKDKRGNYLDFINVDQLLENVSKNKLIPFNFKWLDDILKYEVKPTCCPYPGEGNEADGDTFVSVTLRLQSDAIKKLRSIL